MISSLRREQVCLVRYIGCGSHWNYSCISSYKSPACIKAGIQLAIFARTFLIFTSYVQSEDARKGWSIHYEGAAANWQNKELFRELVGNLKCRTHLYLLPNLLSKYLSNSLKFRVGISLPQPWMAFADLKDIMASPLWNITCQKKSRVIMIIEYCNLPFGSSFAMSMSPASLINKWTSQLSTWFAWGILHR